MKNSLAVIVGAATLALVVAPSKASAQVNIYVSPGGYAHYGYAYPHYGYGYAYPHCGYGYIHITDIQATATTVATGAMGVE